MIKRFSSALFVAALVAGCGGVDEQAVTESDRSETEAETSAAATGDADKAAAAANGMDSNEDPGVMRERLAEALAGSHRSEDNRQRDRYRNPIETLLFLGLEPDSHVVEIWPGGGWYTEILAPALKPEGELVVANYPADSDGDMYGRMGQRLLDKLEADPEVYDQVEVVTLMPPDQATLGPEGSADIVLLSRHFHNLLARAQAETVLAAAHDVLKPGGVLGVIQHRLPEGRPFEASEPIGYVPESVVIDEVEAAGFTLDARSEINANPLDPADHEAGVWTLPPTLATCRDIDDPEQRAACVEPLEAIGESDRMTLRFLKPAGTY